jgi:ribosomal protein S20
MPLYVRELGVTDPGAIAMWSGLIAASTPAISGLLGPLFGRLADRFGRKMMLIRSLAGFVVIMAIMGVVKSVEQLFLVRVIMGLFAGFTPMAMALASTSAPRDKVPMAISIVQSAQLMSAAIGPAAGGYVASHWGIRAAFFVTAGMCALALIGLIVLFHEVPPGEPGEAGAPRKPPPHLSMRRAFGYPNFLLIMSMLLIAQFIDRGLGLLRGMSLTTLRGPQGLPYEDTVCLARGFANDVWVGTTRGAIRMVDGEFHYFAGQRWLPDDRVHAIAVGERAVYFATEKGVGIIEYEPFTLLKKAAYYERHLEEWGQKRLGLVHKLEWDGGLKEFVREAGEEDRLASPDVGAHPDQGRRRQGPLRRVDDDAAGRERRAVGVVASEGTPAEERLAAPCGNRDKLLSCSVFFGDSSKQGFYMANTAQARKRARQAEKTRQRNAGLKSSLRTAVKKVRKAISAGDKTAAAKELQSQQSVIDRIADKKVVHKNTASRSKMRLAQAIKAMP